MLSTLTIVLGEEHFDTLLHYFGLEEIHLVEHQNDGFRFHRVQQTDLREKLQRVAQADSASIFTKPNKIFNMVTD